MNLRARLARLEAREDTPVKRPGRDESERSLELLLHALENARRESSGLEPLPELEYTEEDYEHDLRFLEEGIPEWREYPGWQSEGGQEMLDGWECELREKTENYRKEHGYE